MAAADSVVTVHMAASLDGFVARRDGRVDWMETSDQFPDGAVLDPASVTHLLESIDCYVMGSHTYETALHFEARGMGWSMWEYSNPHGFSLISPEGAAIPEQGALKALGLQAP